MLFICQDVKSTVMPHDLAVNNMFQNLAGRQVGSWMVCVSRGTIRASRQTAGTQPSSSEPAPLRITGLSC